MPSQFEGKDLYEVFGVERTATEKEIRRAYRLLAVRVHPDKTGGGAQATEDFAFLTRAVEILTNPAKRAIYDRTGQLEDVSELYQQSYDYWRERFARVTKQDIEEFAKTYKGSELEKEDLMYCYERFKGDMAKVVAWVPLSSDEDVPRFVEFLQDMIKQKKLKKYKTFNTSRRNLVVDDGAEAEEAKELAKELGLDVLNGEGDSEEGLRQLIVQRRQERQASLLEELERKYGGGAPASSSKRSRKKNKGGSVAQPPDEPPEELFLKNQRALEESKEKAKTAAKVQRKKTKKGAVAAM